SVAQVGDFEIGEFNWVADREIIDRRSDHLIRVSDPECYRIQLGDTPRMRLAQADHQADCSARDITMHDTSQPWPAPQPTRPTPLRLAILTFTRALLPIDYATVRTLVGSIIPRRLPGRSLVAQFLIGLTEPAATDDSALAEVLRECVVGL